MKKYIPVIYISITAVFLGVCIGLLFAKESGNTTVVLARQWQEKYSITETILPPTAGLININAADIVDLCNIPGIGKTTAQKIITYRQENGAFLCIEDLLKIDGVGETTLDKLRDYITIESGE